MFLGYKECLKQHLEIHSEDCEERKMDIEKAELVFILTFRNTFHQS